MSYGTLVIFGYEPIKAMLGLTENYSPLYLKIIAGSMSGGLAALPTNPTDLLKVRMQADKDTPKTLRWHIRKVYNQAGPKGFYVGTK